jgi:hypothetical protein
LPLRQRVEHDSISPVEAAISPLPDDVEALKALVATMARRVEEAEQNAATATAQLANAMAHQSAIEALIAHLKLQIEASRVFRRLLFVRRSHDECYEEQVFA